MHEHEQEHSNKASRPEVSLSTLLADGILTILAGSDTSATTMSNTWYFLLTHPTAFARLRAEIDDAFPPGDEFELTGANANKLADLSYLNAVLNESLRLYPVVPVSIQRSVEPGTGGKILGDNKFIPEGTAVNISSYIIHRDPVNFSPHPERFMPERWLRKNDKCGAQNQTETDSITFHTDNLAFLPFSLGPMNCVGKGLALMEMRAVMATLVRRFEMRFAEEYDPRMWEEELKDYLVLEKGKLPVVLTRR